MPTDAVKYLVRGVVWGALAATILTVLRFAAVVVIVW